MARRKEEKVTSERKKYCHCAPKCNKKLLRKTRRHHYKKIPDNRRHLIRPSESCSDADPESHSGLFPLTLSQGPMNQSHQGQGSFAMLMDSDGSSGGGESGEVFQDELMEESEGEDQGDDEGDYGMSQVSGSKGDDKGTEGYSEDLDSDKEKELGDFSDSEKVDSEFDDWKAFDEEDEFEAENSDEDALREFEEMMGDEEYAELWSTRRYSLVHVLSLFNNILSNRK